MPSFTKKGVKPDFFRMFNARSETVSWYNRGSPIICFLSRPTLDLSPNFVVGVDGGGSRFGVYLLCLSAAAFFRCGGSSFFSSTFFVRPNFFAG